jgi:hypothetical protein
MIDTDKLAAIVEDLIAVMHLEARELEQLVAHVEQVTTRLPEASQLSVVTSELSELQHRIKKLRAPEPPKTAER